MPEPVQACHNFMMNHVIDAGNLKLGKQAWMKVFEAANQLPDLRKTFLFQEQKKVKAEKTAVKFILSTDFSMRIITQDLPEQYDSDSHRSALCQQIRILTLLPERITFC